MNPVRLTKHQLRDLLSSMASSISEDDSFMGSLEYSCYSDDLAPGEFMVSAMWRTGNSQGQGFTHTIGTLKSN